MANEEKPEPLGRPLIRLALVVVVGGVAPLVDTTVVNVALPAMSDEVHVGAQATQWVTTAYLLALAVTVPVTAWASDRFGSKRLWIAGLALFFIGSGLCALAWDFRALVAFRALQGIGAGIMLPVLQTILVRAAGPSKTGRVLTVVMLVSTIAPIAGPLVGGAIVEAGSWRWVFVINLPICATAIGLALRFVPGAPAQAEKRLDLTGVLLLGIGTVALLYALSNAANQGGNATVRVWTPLIAGVALTAGFVALSLIRGTRSAIPVRLLAHKAFGSATASLLLTGVALYGALFLIPLYFQQQRGLTALTAGAVLALQGVGSLLTRWVGGVVDRIGARPIAVVSVLLCAAATVPFAIATPHTSWVLLGAALTVRGGALSAVNIAITAGAFSDLSHEEVPAGSAIVRLVQQLGGAAGTALLATIAAAVGAAAGFHAAFFCSIGLTLVALITCIGIPARRRTQPAAALGADS
ncbi:DHA2 family efflux MFS transporter permease subunit [Amycolatopsis taiwanensis]|uniref:DHA2 family efflux MFS transporter permease subunit n=1 Tax=Amycolatopsis taiwanensis TaxID=342230 RepID=UPI0004AFE3C5|nr:DHA2 family efflux MFS transporter permease subunit [Amycolatopsis taiwanensis]